MEQYLAYKEIDIPPRLPLEGKIDLTYRCNNHCRHCWLWVPPDAPEKDSELSFEEIKRIVDEAKSMGCQRWLISGGEPMFRPDFPRIFDYITGNCRSYSINTNGTLITPEIAKLMKRKGSKMVALYGATAEVHDHITRRQGSFDEVMRGFAYLKEAGAGFIVQLIPMKDNYHQFEEMVKLAKSLSRYYRIGAPWLYLSADGNANKNNEILRQRLSPKEVVELDKPDLSYSYEECMPGAKQGNGCGQTDKNGYLFSSCIASRRDFHIDPYGKMTFCFFVKDPDMRYDLRKGSFRDCWEMFIPSLARRIKMPEEYKNGCKACRLSGHCRWCSGYGYLEHGRHGAKVEYLCKVAKENKSFKENLIKNHRRYYKIADITIQVDSDLPITDKTFHSKFKLFQADGPGEDTISIRHHFSFLDMKRIKLGKPVYRKLPWAVYKKRGSWIYLGISSLKDNEGLHKVMIFNKGHTQADIYNENKEVFGGGDKRSLALLPTDQIVLARVLADRQGCYMHACGVDFEGKGMLFVGHSEAGKSTMANILKGKAKILCDDRIIIKQHKGGFRIYGTWSHGDVPEISADCADLYGIFFLKKSGRNQILRINNPKYVYRYLLSCLIRPFVTVDWWHKMFLLIDNISSSVPAYMLYFDKSSSIIEALKRI